MSRARLVRGVAALVAVTAALVVAGCGGGSSRSGGGSPVADLAGPIQFSTPEPGGTYRLAQTDFGFTGAFDPTGEYLGAAWGLYSDMLLRTLMTYKHTAGRQATRWSRTSPRTTRTSRRTGSPTRST